MSIIGSYDTAAAAAGGRGGEGTDGCNNFTVVYIISYCTHTHTHTHYTQVACAVQK